MVALDMLGRRGALRLLWELRGEPLTFRALQAACDSNPGSLNTRLKELRELGIVDHDAGGYRLTEHGRCAYRGSATTADWADEWAKARVRSRTEFRRYAFHPRHRREAAIRAGRPPPAATNAATIAANQTHSYLHARTREGPEESGVSLIASAATSVRCTTGQQDRSLNVRKRYIGHPGILRSARWLGGMPPPPPRRRPASASRCARAAQAGWNRLDGRVGDRVQRA